VFKAALARLAVERPGPGMPVAGAVSEPGERDTQSLVAAPAELGGLAFAGLFRDRGLAGVSGERVPVGIASAAVADLSEQFGSRDHTVSLLEQGQEDRPVGMCADCCPDVSLQPLDLPVQGSDHRHVGEHELPAGGELEFTDPSLGGATELRQQGRWLLGA
jgi:hypothetical protein